MSNLDEIPHNPYQVIGIIDFENCSSGDPIYDFAWWDYFVDRRIPTEWLKEGYTDKTIFDDNFERKLHLYRLHLSLGFIDYFEREKNEGGINWTKINLQKDLEYFRR